MYCTPVVIADRSKFLTFENMLEVSSKFPEVSMQSFMETFQKVSDENFHPLLAPWTQNFKAKYPLN